MTRFKKVLVDQIVPTNKVTRKIKRNHSKNRKVKRGGKRKHFHKIRSNKKISNKRRSNKKQLTMFKKLSKSSGKKIRMKNGKWISI